MQYTKIDDNIKISRLGLGSWTIGGLSFNNGYDSGWADCDETEVEKAVMFACEKGVNHFDSADCYGNGKSEKLLAKYLKNYKNKVIISSKVGFIKNEFEHAYLPQNILKQCENSLKNLNRDFIDIYYFHHAEFGHDDKYLDAAVNAMAKLKQEGKIRKIGLSCYKSQDFVRLVPKIKPDILQGMANILDDKFIKEKSLVRQILDKQKIPFVAFSPLSSGILTGKYSALNLPKFPSGDHRRNLHKFSKCGLQKAESQILKFRFDDLIHDSFQFLLDHDCVSSIIFGFRNLEQVKNNLKGF